MSKIRSKITLTNRQGICPICGGARLNFGYNGISDEWMYSEWDCLDCKADGRQVHKIQFDTHEQIKFKKNDDQNYYIDDLKNYGIDTDDEDDVEDDIPQLD